MHRTVLRIAAASIAFAPAVAFAHPGHAGKGLVEGFMHPLGLLYGLGFIAATVMLHGVGLGLGLTIAGGRRNLTLRAIRHRP